MRLCSAAEQGKALRRKAKSKLNFNVADYCKNYHMLSLEKAAKLGQDYTTAIVTADFLAGMTDIYTYYFNGDPTFQHPHDTRLGQIATLTTSLAIVGKMVTPTYGEVFGYCRDAINVGAAAILIWMNKGRLSTVETKIDCHSDDHTIGAFFTKMATWLFGKKIETSTETGVDDLSTPETEAAAKTGNKYQQYTMRSTHILSALFYVICKNVS